MNRRLASAGGGIYLARVSPSASATTRGSPGEPSAEDVTRANVSYHAELAPDYDDRMELFHPRVRRVYRELIEGHVLSHFDAGAPLSALDVGCGTGLLEDYLLPRVRDLVAFDVSEAMLAVARAKHPGVRFVRGDAYAMPPEADREFDVVCANALLHHLKDYERVLDAMVQRLRPGGVLFLGYEPNAIAFSLLAPLRALYRKLLPEERVEAVAARVGDDVESLAEYHQFYRNGISARRIARRLRSQGCDDVRVFYRAEHFLGLLQDRTGRRWLDFAPSALLRLVGPLAVSFHLVARKQRVATKPKP